MYEKTKSFKEFKSILSIKTQSFPDKVEIQIKDNGIGIPKKDIEKVLLPFFTTKPTGESIGLGLPLSFEIVVEEHRGTFSLNSEQGLFTEVNITLPKRFLQP